MEFLIVAFIIISILSSLTRNRRRVRKKEDVFDPWSFDVDSESVKEDTEGLPGEPEGEEGYAEEEPEPESVANLTATREPLPETFPEEEPVKEAEFIPYVEREAEMISTPVMGEKRKTAELREIGKLEEELKALLTGRRLPLAIVASEILGPPRSRIHYNGRRMHQMRSSIK